MNREIGLSIAVEPLVREHLRPVEMETYPRRTAKAERSRIERLEVELLDAPADRNDRRGRWRTRHALDDALAAVDDQGVTIAEGLSGSEAVVLSAGPFVNPGQKVNPRRQAAR